MPKSEPREFEAEIASIRLQLQDQVVEIYLDLVYEPNFLLEDGDPNRNARRQFYVEELGADAQVLIDRLRRAFDDQEASVRQAEQAQSEIEQAQTEINAALNELADLREAQEKAPRGVEPKAGSPSSTRIDAENQAQA